MKEDRIIEKINGIKKDLGEKLLILTHHYQRKEIVGIGHHKGDSFDLSRKASLDKAARNIVFCGVHFMAESAAILARPHQTVQIPDYSAGCPMADMADIVAVEKAWDEITGVTGNESATPVVYMNSDAEIKAFCGRNGGTVCTSSNAHLAFKWGLEQREKVLFFPDRHLGRNTGSRLGIPADRIILWRANEPLGGNTPEDVKKAELILWDGFCHVHTLFQPKHILDARKKFPDAKIVVHPECEKEVVDLADGAGSTSFIVEYTKNAPANSRILIGTEINLIRRLAIENPDKTVLELHPSKCPNMAKINLENLLHTLENPGQFNNVEVPDNIRADSRKALDRMLELAP